MSTRQVIATARGYFDALREPGEKFEIPADYPDASWFEDADGGDGRRDAKASVSLSKPKIKGNDHSLV